MSFAPGNNSANYNSCADWNGQNGNVTTVGSNGGPSAYGTFDQSGNLYEWNDLDGNPGSSRGLRGGLWRLDAFYLSSSSRITYDPSNENNNVGFRLSSSSSVLNPLNLPYFVSVDDINNSNDSTGYGSVSYLYQIAQYQVTNCEYAQFLNAIAGTDTYNLYNPDMGTDARGGISRSGSSGSYTYSVKADMGNKPVIYVSWFDAARYCNWLHNSRPTGSQNNSTTEDGAYTLNGATSGNAVVKNANASYSIPTENEWYKAAYYKGGGTNAGYWTYATQSNIDPTCVSANSIGDGPVNSNYSCEQVSVTPTITPTNSVTPSVTPTTTPTNTVTPSVTPTTTPTNSITPTNTVTPTVTPTKAAFPVGANSANYNSCADWNGQNGNVTTVGSNGGPSAYGTFDQSGNLYEWNDLDGNPGSSRGLRGGGWNGSAFNLSSSGRVTFGPPGEYGYVGFRLASSSSILNPLNLPYFVSVGDINNSNDSTGYGSVSYLYQIAQYQVTNCEYAQFLNAVASTDTYGLYNANMGTNARGGITRNGSSGSYTYSVKANMGNKPVIYVSWFDAARYCNWLHNNKPTGGQNNTTTENGAYTLNGATTGVSIVRNAGGTYSLPTENEWYKAAYYKGGGFSAGYWTYATQRDNTPTCVIANSTGDGPVSSDYSCDSVGTTPTVTPTNSVTPTNTPTNSVTPTRTPNNTPTRTPTNTTTPTRTPTNTPTRTVTPTPTKTPQPTSLSAACRNSCCYYVCVENYDEYNNCIVNNIVINFEGNTIQNFNNDEYQLLVEGNCVDPFSNTLDIKGSKDDCYGCSIVSSNNNNNCDDNNLFKIIASDNEHKFPTIINNTQNTNNNNNNIFCKSSSVQADISDTNIKCCLIASRTPLATPTNTITPTSTT